MVTYSVSYYVTKYIPDYKCVPATVIINVESLLTVVFFNTCNDFKLLAI